MALENIVKGMQELGQAEGILRQYDKVFQKAEALKQMAEGLDVGGQYAGEHENYAQSEEYKSAAAAKELYDTYVTVTAEKVKENLAGIIADTAPEKRIRLLTAVQNRNPSEGLGKLVDDYITYNTFLATDPKNIEKIKDEKTRAMLAKQYNDAVKKVSERLPELIKERVKKNITDERLVNAWTKYLLAIAPQGYAQKVIAEEYEAVSKKVEDEMQNTGNITAYLQANIEKDEEYINLANRYLHATQPDEED